MFAGRSVLVFLVTLAIAAAPVVSSSLGLTRKGSAAYASVSAAPLAQDDNEDDGSDNGDEDTDNEDDGSDNGDEDTDNEDDNLFGADNDGGFNLNSNAALGSDDNDNIDTINGNDSGDNDSSDNDGVENIDTYNDNDLTDNEFDGVENIDTYNDNDLIDNGSGDNGSGDNGSGDNDNGAGPTPTPTPIPGTATACVGTAQQITIATAEANVILRNHGAAVQVTLQSVPVGSVPVRPGTPLGSLVVQILASDCGGAPRANLPGLADLSVQYNSAVASGLNKANLKILHLEGSSWVALASQRSEPNFNEVVASTNLVGFFTVSDMSALSSTNTVPTVTVGDTGLPTSTPTPTPTATPTPVPTAPKPAIPGR